MRKSVINKTLPVVLTLVASPSLAQDGASVGDMASSLVAGGLAFAQGNVYLVGSLLGFVAFALVLKSKFGRRGGKAPDVLAIHSLVAMSQVAIADGRIEDNEVRHISQILTRLTGTPYAPQQVMEMLQRLNPSAADLPQVGRNLSDKDRQIVLEAALNIAVADGEIHPNEYAIVSDLAQRMRIGGDQFRSVMARISAHLQGIQPV